jgi:rRNA maturation endonuclease Nob1
MSWGVNLMYYRCPACGKKFKYAEDMIPVFQDTFGCCPVCGTQGVFEKNGARTIDDFEYEEVE